MLEKNEIEKKAISILNTFLKLNNGNLIGAKKCSIYLIEELIKESYKLDLRYFNKTFDDLNKIKNYLETL
jgi:hypothetical protein